ncbi:hypothetical protein AMECASPLE_018511 [Ameca splendens]|uniref:Uncharacterized protein n=1 Tax=Ameca splendens TaxID=208324 RepID=A0ABV0YPP5_9TELE
MDKPKSLKSPPSPTPYSGQTMAPHSSPQSPNPSGSQLIHQAIHQPPPRGQAATTPGGASKLAPMALLPHRRHLHARPAASPGWTPKCLVHLKNSTLLQL